MPQNTPADVPAGGHVDPAPADPGRLASALVDARFPRCLRDKRELVGQVGEFF